MLPSFMLLTAMTDFSDKGDNLSLTFDRLIIPIKYIEEVKLNAGFNSMG